MNCTNCQKETNNDKFCSRSCSVSFNNKKSPRRKLEGYCKGCQRIISKKRKYCKSCEVERTAEDKTLGEAIYVKHHKSSAFALVRTRARAVMKKLGINTCQSCTYCKHVEVAHVKSISSFSLDTLLSVINHPSNLLALCPNCHWEFDHKLLEIAPLGVEPRTRCQNHRMISVSPQGHSLRVFYICLSRRAAFPCKPGQAMLPQYTIQSGSSISSMILQNFALKFARLFSTGSIQESQ